MGTVAPIQKDSLTAHQRMLRSYMNLASPINGMFTGSELDVGEFANSRVIAVPDIRVDDYIVDAEIARIGVSHYEGSEFTGEWKNGIPPIEWRYYSTSRHRSFGYTVFAEQEKYAPIKNLPQEYLARKMSTTVLRDHDKYLLLAIVLGRMTGKLVARTSSDAYTSQIESTTGISAARISCTGNQADYKWIAQPGEQSDNETQPSFATIKGMVFDAADPLKTLDALTTQFGENWFDTNMPNSDRFMLITTSLELAFRDQLIKAGTYVDAGFDTYKNTDLSGVTGPAFFGSLRGWTFAKIHPEFMPKVFTDSSYVIDPSPTLTGVATATGRTLRQVVALAAYKSSAQTHDFFEDKRQEDGGVRGDFTEYVQRFSYDAWVIDQKSEGIVPIFLPADLDGNGTTDTNYTPVNDSFTRVAAALATARGQLTTSPSVYPASGPDVAKSRPEWFSSPYTDTNALNAALTVQETGDTAHTNPTPSGSNPVDAEELAGAVSAILTSATVRADSTGVTLGQQRRFASPTSLWQVTVAGTTAASQPSITGKVVNETVVDGGATWKRII
jgi:hypothetical protein